MGRRGPDADPARPASVVGEPAGSLGPEADPAPPGSVAVELAGSPGPGPVGRHHDDSLRHRTARRAGAAVCVRSAAACVGWTCCVPIHSAVACELPPQSASAHERAVRHLPAHSYSWKGMGSRGPSGREISALSTGRLRITAGSNP
jgi:hypothetical protein